MSDILFRCPKCQASYAVEDTDAGQDFTCASCGNSASVPTPDIQMICGSCRSELLTSDRYRGETFNCPNCDGKVFVPKVSLKDQSSYPLPTPRATDEMRSYSRREPQRNSVPFVIPRWVIPLVLLLLAAGAYTYFKSVHKQVEQAPARGVDQDPAKDVDYTELKCGLMALCSMEQLDKTNYAGGFSALDYTQHQFPGSGFSSVLSKSNYMASCSRCNGTGEIRIPCPACKGSGKCSYCKASGICPKCKGAGKLPVACTICKGSGKCSDCGGVGKVDAIKTGTKEVPVQGLARTSHAKGVTEMTRTVKTEERVTIACPTCNGSGKCQHCTGGTANQVQCTVCAGRGQCPRCNGSGKCLKCAGVGSSGSKCAECSGTGSVVSRERIQQNRDLVLPKIQALISTRQAHEPKSESLQAIVDCLRRTDWSNAVMKVDSSELFFFHTFDAKEQNAATTNNVAGPK